MESIALKQQLLCPYYYYRNRINQLKKKQTSPINVYENVFEFLTFVNMFAHIRYICAYFTTKPDCNLHYSNEIDANEKTEFLCFVKDNSTWFDTIHTDIVSKECRFDFEKSLPEFFQDPKQHFDADVYKRYIKDKLTMKDAFRLENKTQVIKQISSILKNMCRQTCKCDSMKTLPFILYFAKLQDLLSDMWRNDRKQKKKIDMSNVVCFVCNLCFEIENKFSLSSMCVCAK